MINEILIELENMIQIADGSDKAHEILNAVNKAMLAGMHPDTLIRTLSFISSELKD